MTEPIEKITDELLPCPFCGSQPIQFTVLNAYKCESCQTDQGWMSKQIWNTRLTSAEKDAKIKELTDETWSLGTKASELATKIKELEEELARTVKTSQDSREEVISAKAWKERFANLILSKIEQNGKEDTIRLDILYKLIWQVD